VSQPPLRATAGPVGKEALRHDATGIDPPVDGAWDAGEVEGQEQERRLGMPSHTLHVMQAFEEREGGIVPVEPKACLAVGSARALAARLAPTHAGCHRLVKNG
jgi:hypothetical protein